MQTVLIIDDEQAICLSLMFALEDRYRVITATSAREGLSLMSLHSADAVLLDMRIAKTSGLEMIPQLLDIHPRAMVIMMTAYGTIETSVQAIKAGAYHYLTKPLNVDEVRLLIEKALDYTRLKDEVQRLHEAIAPQDSYCGMIGKSREMQQLFQLLDKVKEIDSNVLISGESGTGKEVVAKICHFEGIRKAKPFSPLNCAAIPESLLESELFGYERGAFTGAMQRKEGIFEMAEGGTVFLDEIGEMPLQLQAKLLRVIQEREISPVGSGKPRTVNVRIIAATNRNLLDEVRKGTFREDLYYRLNVIPIHIPPLRERREDIPLLINRFLETYSLKMNKSGLCFDTETLQFLCRYSYPGNVRELANMVEYAVALANGPVLTVRDLPLYLQEGASLSEESGVREEQPGIYIPGGLPLEEAEKRIIVQTLETFNGHRKKTAEALGISERGLRDKLNKLQQTNL